MGSACSRQNNVSKNYEPIKRNESELIMINDIKQMKLSSLSKTRSDIVNGILNIPNVDKNSLVQLLYSSESVHKMTDAEIKELARKASENNSKHNITGALIYINGVFIQILEGGYEMVSSLYAKIKEDKRHYNSVLISSTNISNREYNSWGMKYADLDIDSDIDNVIKTMLQNIRSSFNILDKYTQPAITSLIRQGVDPLYVPSIYGEAIAMVCSLNGISETVDTDIDTLNIIACLGTFYSIVTSEVEKHNGDIIKYIGEDIMIMFEIDNICDALQCSKNIMTKIQNMDVKLDIDDCRISLTCGKMIRGNIGSANTKYDYTLLGDTVNVCCRMCHLPIDEKYSILISKSIVQHIQQLNLYENIESIDVHLKGKRYDQTIYMLTNNNDFKIEYTYNPLSESSLEAWSDTENIDDQLLIKLVYVSRANGILSSDIIKEIVEKSSHNNNSIGITGVLLNCGDIFLQILEGPPKIVKNLYQKISKDPRHRDVTTISLEAIDSRKYNEWNMKGFDIGEASEFVMKVASKMLDAMANAFKTIEKYTPSKILNLLVSGKNPMEYKPHQTHTIILATDMVGFTTISESVSPKELIFLVNNMLKIVLRCIDDNGGCANKIVGDMIVAQFPISRARDAVKAGVDIQNRLKTFRQRTVQGIDPSIVYCGVGISYGKVIEGNIGKTQIDFSLIGKCVDHAIVAEAYTRSVDANLLITSDMMEILKKIHPTNPKLEKRDTYYTVSDVDSIIWDPDNVIETIRHKLNKDL